MNQVSLDEIERRIGATGMTLEKIGCKAHRSRAWLQMLLKRARRSNRLRGDSLAALAKALSCNPEDLMPKRRRSPTPKPRRKA